MKRHTFAFRTAEGKKDGFRRFLGKNWETVRGILDRNGLKNFSLWEAKELVFGYCEGGEEALLSGEDKEQLRALTEEAGAFGEWLAAPGQGMRLMYHNFGIVRDNKELIRHRVFMTRLHPGCEEEYKKRHDVLVKSRGDAVDPGPDSNFGIWNAGGYIFGYNEIDTTMETEETKEQHQATVDWETRQLEIMDWITNDVDWLTGQHNAAVRRLAWHQ